MNRDTYCYIWVPSSLILDVSRDGASTAPPGNLFRCFTTFTVKKLFPYIQSKSPPLVWSYFSLSSSLALGQMVYRNTLWIFHALPQRMLPVNLSVESVPWPMWNARPHLGTIWGMLLNPEQLGQSSGKMSECLGLCSNIAVTNINIIWSFWNDGDFIISQGDNTAFSLLSSLRSPKYCKVAKNNL